MPPRKLHDPANAFFLPFDLQAFDFSPNHTRPAQEEAFRKLNYLVDRTDIKFNNYSHNVILSWYHNSPTQTLDVPGSKFVDDPLLPAGWRGNSSDMSVYKRVIAPQCRTCHISQPSGSVLDFDTAAEFRARQDVVGFQCGNYLMPNAERTLQLSWTSSSRAILMNYFGVRLEGKP